MQCPLFTLLLIETDVPAVPIYLARAHSLHGGGGSGAHASVRSYMLAEPASHFSMYATISAVDSSLDTSAIGRAG